MLKIASIGAGYWGKNLIRNFHELGALHTICDSSQATLTAFEEKYPDIHTSLTLEAALNDDEVDAVAIATPAETHSPLIRRSLESGKHVYVEKPLCLDETEGAELVALADQKGLTLMVGHLLWYHPAVLKIQEKLQNGDLGKLRYLFSNRLNMGLLRNQENVLWSFAPHDISMILGLVGANPIKVTAQGSEFLTKGLADTTIASLEFEGGIGAHIFVSWLNPFKEQKLVVVGEKSMLVFDDTLPWEQKLVEYGHTVDWKEELPVANKADPNPIELVQTEPLKDECRHFIDCVESSVSPRTNGQEGLSVLKVLNQIQQQLDAAK